MRMPMLTAYPISYEFSDNVPNRPSESAWLTLSSEVGDTFL